MELRLVLDSDHTDPLCRTLRNGGNPNAAALELMSRLVRPGRRVLDLGCHVGQFALTAAALGHEVLAVDGSPRNADLLRASARLNGLANLHVVNCAVGAATALAAFCEDGPHGSVAGAGVPRRVTLHVPVLSAETLLSGMGWDRLALVKIDVEGYEIEALAGLRRFLAGPAAPAVIYESNAHTLDFFRRTPGDLHRALTGQGYRIYQIGEKRLTACEPDDFQGPTCVDYLAVKDALPTLPDWLIHDAFTEAELRAQVEGELASHNPDERASIARRLAAAGDRLLADARLQSALQGLHRDPNPTVRAAVAWHTPRAA
jgi:FkbM family methyltransferase